MNADKDIYFRILDNRPFKLSPEEAEYRESKGEEKCERCIHFFVRKVDDFSVCEVMRPTDEEEEAVYPNFVCKFFTDDGEEFPLLSE